MPKSIGGILTLVIGAVITTVIGVFVINKIPFLRGIVGG